MSQTHELPHFTITPEAILVKGLTGRPLATINLRFSVGASEYHVTEMGKHGAGFLGRTQDPAVTVEITPSGDALSVELRGSFTAEDSVVYFTGSTVTASYGRAFVPDANCRLFLTADKEDFHLTNSGKVLQNKLGNSVELWMIAPPPHVFSFGEAGAGWFGFSIPEPMPVEFTRLSCHARRLHLAFSGYSPRHDAGRLPRVSIDGGLTDSKAILDRHRAHAEDLGLIDKAKKTYSWWHNPVYCSWGDQCYEQKVDPVVMGDPVSTPLDEERLLRWADGVRKIYPGEVNYIVDAGWFEHLGDYLPVPAFGTVAGFKATLDKLRARGFRVILWYTPFWVQAGALVEREHPEYLVRTRDGGICRDDANRAFLDFSRPDVREYTRGRIEFLLKTLDADGFKIDMNFSHPFMSDITLFDSSWGHGNQFWLRVAAFIHGTATALKEDAFLTLSGIESYLQPYAGSIRLNDLFDYYRAKPWYNRAEMVARLMPNVPIDVDGWPASIEKMREYQFVSPVFGAPVAYYIEAVDIMSVKLTEADLNRMASVWHVYSKAPCEHGMTLKIDADTATFERRDAAGRLRATVLQNSALVCFADERIYLTANGDRAVSFPVESPEKYTRAEKVFRDGRREPVPLFKDGPALVLNISDAGSGVLCYEIS